MGRRYNKEVTQKYVRSEKCKKTRKMYIASKKGKDAYRHAHAKYRKSPIGHAKYNIRCVHGRFKPWKWLKVGLRHQGFDPQIHHGWLPNSSDYTGVALVEANKHMQGIISPLIILEGKVEISGDDQHGA